ncbi:hypothetical protein BDF20DRAFT_836359 [Mycotypha africana]|uniref:uncharacterized protein n=1 Tax=Mycotypha africana TaxID=64632 RepID=UPI0023019E74|nr:uncharacterized protein BDF20DRAFT_836359 [Mycotypha africana]KAI8977575.1 hypothetical protein BDF20DRAFT_836359 [Mycotypha africana]
MTCQHESLGAEMCPYCGYCNHEIIFKDLCAICGSLVVQDDRDEGTANNNNQHFDISHRSDGVRVSFKEAQRLEKKDEERLLKEKKLSLIVDLDQTVLHAAWEPHIAQWVDDHKAQKDPLAENMFTFSLDGTNKYTIKLRPGLSEFLKEISQYYEMHIYTMGTRAYAEAVAKVIDPTGELFRDRILSRDENGSVMKKRLERLFPSDHTKVVVLDDRADVWDFSQNLIQIKPYEYFAGVGDINAPPSIAASPANDSNMLKQTTTTTETTETVTTDTTTIDKMNETTEQDGHSTDKGALSGEEPTTATMTPMTTTTTTTTTTNTTEKDSSVTPTIVNDDAVNESIVNDIKHHQHIPPPATTTMPVIDPEKLVESENKKSKETDDAMDTTADASLTHTTSDESAAANAAANAANTTTLHRSNPYSTDSHYNATNSMNSYTPKSHDSDTILKVVQKTLIEVHCRFYEKVEKENARPNVADILNGVKSHVLSGCHLVFSGVIPLQVDPTTSSLWKMATSYGAQCWEELTGKVTHLIAAHPCTTKVNKARKYPKIQIVSPPWLFNSVWNWKKEEEEKYKLELPQDKYADSESDSEDIEDIEAVDRAFDRFTKQKGKERSNGEEEEAGAAGETAMDDRQEKVEETIDFDWTDDEVDDAMNEEDSDEDDESEASEDKDTNEIERTSVQQRETDDDEEEEDEEDEDFLNDILNELDEEEEDEENVADREEYGDESDNESSGTKRKFENDDDDEDDGYSDREDSRRRKSFRSDD